MAKEGKEAAPKSSKNATAAAGTEAPAASGGKSSTSSSSSSSGASSKNSSGGSSSGGSSGSSGGSSKMSNANSASTSSSSSDDGGADLTYVLWYLMLFVAVAPVAWISVMAYKHEVSLSELTPSKAMVPPFVLQAVVQWAQVADPVMASNPGWLVAMEGFNLAVTCPLYLLTALGFLFGWRWIRGPATINAVWTMYQIVLHATETYMTQPQPQEPFLYISVYASAFVLSIFTLKRLASSKPFKYTRKTVAVNAAFFVLSVEAWALLAFHAFRFAVVHLKYGTNWQHPYLVQARDFVLQDATAKLSVTPA